MKTIFKIAAMMLLAAGSFVSCENKGEENPKKTVCNVNDPLTDLPWLKEIVNGFEGGMSGMYMNIYQCIYNTNQGLKN